MNVLFLIRNSLFTYWVGLVDGAGLVTSSNVMVSGFVRRLLLPGQHDVAAGPSSTKGDGIFAWRAAIR